MVVCTKADLIDEGNDIIGSGPSGMGGMVKGKGGEWEERTGDEPERLSRDERGDCGSTCGRGASCVGGDEEKAGSESAPSESGYMSSRS